MLLNINELSTELKISVSGLYQMVSQRRVPFVKIGRSVRFDSDEIRKWLAKQKIDAQDVR